MRLLQLAIAPDRLIDLHPNVSVLYGLDDADRRVLVDTVVGLGRGTASNRRGLLEAHGLLFDLSDDMLSRLDMSADGLRPLVTAADLPTISDAATRERIAAQRVLGAIDERWAASAEHQGRLRVARDAAIEALERARRNADGAETGAAERPQLIVELTAQLDQIDERRRHLHHEQAERVREAEKANALRSEVEAATVEVRTRHEETAILSSELAARLDHARRGLDPDSVAEAEAARVELARVRAEVKAARAAEAPGAQAPSARAPSGKAPSGKAPSGKAPSAKAPSARAPSGKAEPEAAEPLAKRRARAQTRLEELEKGRAAFDPTQVHEVSSALEQLRAPGDEQVLSPEAEALADKLAALGHDLATAPEVATTSDDMAACRTRLDDARNALREAEQAARSIELDHAAVDGLELAHAELVDALEKAEGRRGGARAQRRVEAARSAEHALLEALGFGSYADYMMGYSLLAVDPVMEAALGAARDELAAAEEEWQTLVAATEAELTRDQLMEQRQVLLTEANTLLGRPVAAEDAIDELRALQVPATATPELLERLQDSLARAGIAVDGELTRDELVQRAERWLEEAHEAAAREQELHAEMDALNAERAASEQALHAEGDAVGAERAVTDAVTDDVAPEGPRPKEDHAARLSAARAAEKAADERERLHREAEALVDSVAAELAVVTEAAQIAADEASGAEAAVAEAVGRARQLGAEVVRIAEELRGLDQTEVEANEQLRSLEHASPEQLALDVTEAEAALTEADARLVEGSASLQDLALQHAEAQAVLTSLYDSAEAVDERSLAEEIEWYLLARMAAQRAVCLGGSLPLLLDGALAGLDAEQLGQVLGRLERMADAVQVIVLSDDPFAASWALMAGQDRAAVVRPQPA